MNLLDHVCVLCFFACIVYSPVSADRGSCSYVSPRRPTIPPLSYPTCATGTLDGRYWYLSLLGYGSASSVLKAAVTPLHCSYRRSKLQNTNPFSQGAVAIKVYDPEPFSERWDAYSSEIVNEYETMRMLKHPNILQAHELILQGPRFLMVLEYCTTSLMSLLSSSALSRTTAMEIYGKVLQAVYHMHTNGFAHRDIKFENILLCNEEYKLADLGSAVRWRDDTGRIFMTRVVEGTGAYMAPELVQDEVAPYRADRSDIWALGIFYVSMVLRRFPWEVAREEDGGFRDFLEAGGRENILGLLEEEEQRIIGRMLVVEGTKRAEWTEIFEDAWVRRMIEGNL